MIQVPATPHRKVSPFWDMRHIFLGSSYVWHIPFSSSTGVSVWACKPDASYLCPLNSVDMITLRCRLLLWRRSTRNLTPGDLLIWKSHLPFLGWLYIHNRRSKYNLLPVNRNRPPIRTARDVTKIKHKSFVLCSSPFVANFTPKAYSALRNMIKTEYSDIVY